MPFGFPGLLLYKAADAMDSMIGWCTPRHRAYGMTAARLDGALYLYLAACLINGAWVAATAVIRFSPSG